MISQLKQAFKTTHASDSTDYCFAVGNRLLKELDEKYARMFYDVHCESPSAACCGESTCKCGGEEQRIWSLAVETHSIQRSMEKARQE